jgi:DedD protein
MQEQIRQRLIGAIVLIVIAALTWPLLFDDFDPQAVDHRSQVPEMPKFETFEVTENSSAVVDTESKTVDAQTSISASSTEVIDISTESRVRATPLAVSKLDEQGVPMTWVVQVGSFADEGNAKKLLDRLTSKGHQAYMRSNNTGPKTVYRLYIGPLLEKRKAIQINTQIKKQFNLNGLVVRYKVHDS